MLTDKETIKEIGAMAQFRKMKNKSIPQIIKDVKKRTDLIRYPFDEFWFMVGFNECEKIQEERYRRIQPNCDKCRNELRVYFSEDFAGSNEGTSGWFCPVCDRDTFWKKKLEEFKKWAETYIETNKVYPPKNRLILLASIDKIFKEKEKETEELLKRVKETDKKLRTLL